MARYHFKSFIKMYCMYKLLYDTLENKLINYYYSYFDDVRKQYVVKS